MAGFQGRLLSLLYLKSDPRMLNSTFLKTFSGDQQQRLEKYFERIELNEQEFIYREGEPADRAFLVDEGEVRFELATNELDCERVLEVVGKGGLFGAAGLLDCVDYQYNAIASTQIKARSLSRAAMEQMRIEDPALSTDVYQALGKAVVEKLHSAIAAVSEHRFMTYGHSAEVDEIVGKARQAQQEFVGWSERRVDELLYALCEPIIENSAELALNAVTETHLGNVPDKTLKHVSAALGVYAHIVGRRGSGGKTRLSPRVLEIADAMGVIFGLIPATNPVSTTCFKSLISIKSRNSIILNPTRVGSRVVIKTVDLLREVLRKHGAPEDLIQVVRGGLTRQTTSMFMHHKDIDLVLATGGASMVRAAYSSGTPAIGVGPGNAPCVIASDADLDHAAISIVKSKSFDNGVICGAENNLICVAEKYDSFITSLERHGAAVLTVDETAMFTNKGLSTGSLGRRIIGQDPESIAEYIGICRKYPIRLIVVPTNDASRSNPMASEKTAPVLSLFKVSDEQEAMSISEQLLEIDGAGHTAIIHTKSRKLTAEFATRMKVSRILVNSPGAQGIMGACTGLTPSFTLGCGTYGGTSTTDNISFQHLINVKRVAWYLPYKKKTVEIVSGTRWLSALMRGARLVGVCRRRLSGVK